MIFVWDALKSGKIKDLIFVEIKVVKLLNNFFETVFGIKIFN
jgi:hypothetical protein